MDSKLKAAHLAQIESELVADGSIELIETSTAVIHPGQELLPYAMSVFVPDMASS